MNSKSRVLAFVLFGLSAVGGLSSCKKRSPTEGSRSPSGLTPERIASMEEGANADLVAAARDKAEFVRPAPPDFRPEPVAAKLEMTLILEKRRIHVGNPIRYRLEIQNVARDTYTFIESPHSFLKDGSLSDTPFKALLTCPNGKMVQLDSPSAGMADIHEIKLPNERFLTEAQKKEALEALNSKEESARELIAILGPGETLLSRSDPEKSGYRPLDIELSALKPGHYVLQFAFQEPTLDSDDSPDVPTIHSLESEKVSFEIVR